MGNLPINRWFWPLLALLGMGLGLPNAAWAVMDCKVTTTGDVIGGESTPGSFRKMLSAASVGQCNGNKIIFHVPKVTMNAPLGTGALVKLQGLTIEPAPGIAEVEIVVKYNNPNLVASCSAPSKFSDCFAYLPVSNVSLRHVRVTVDPATISPPLRGLCIGPDMTKEGGPNNNAVVIQDSRFDGFPNGGVGVSPDAYGVQIRKTTFNNSGAGIVIEENPDVTKNADAPLMGGSAEALHAVVDENGVVQEYHLRGISGYADETSIDIVAVELFEATAGAGSKYLQDCDLHKKGDLIDGKWDIDCVLPADIPLPFHYAVTLTLPGSNIDGTPSTTAGTSMFSSGTIPVDVAKLSTVKPLSPQAPVVPPTTPPDKNPPVFEDTDTPSGDVSTPLSLNVAPFESSGCSLIR